MSRPPSAATAWPTSRAASSAGADVGGQALDARAGGVADLVRRLADAAGVAAADDQGDALARQAHRGGKAEPAAGRQHERTFSGELQIHGCETGQ